MGKSTISMAIFNSYVSLPEGTVDDSKFVFTKVGWGDGDHFNGQWLPQLHFFQIQMVYPHFPLIPIIIPMVTMVTML